MDLLLKEAIQNFYGSPQVVISHLRIMLVVSVEKLAKKCMCYLECHNIHSKIKSKIFFKMFLISEFSYFQLVCMYHSTTLINRIKNIQYRVLRIVCQDKKSTFKDLFQKGKAVSIHMKNATLDYRNLYSKKWYIFSFSFEKKNYIF